MSASKTEPANEGHNLTRSSVRLWPNAISPTAQARLSGLNVDNNFRLWNEVSMLNYVPSEILPSAHAILLRRSIIPLTSMLDQDKITELIPQYNYIPSAVEYLQEKFLKYKSSLMNEDNYWGCFYVLPELYDDIYSPVVQVVDVENVPAIVGGVLTHDMVNACISYLKRNPILGDYVLIKLDLSSKRLVNIEVLQNYKYLVYLDLSSNLLKDLTVLNYLPYLQFLNVSYNRLDTVLDYDKPQWFLTEIHYKYNSVKRIRDLDIFWSITILDLSHNNIKAISGLNSLRYLRRLDLSFNHIQRFENLDHLRLLWLDLSYNNISSFDLGPNSGLWTLMHLEYLNLNENSLTSMKIFLYCTRLRELYARNNRLSVLLEVAVYMAQMRRLVVLDLRGNPICATSGYKDVVVNTFPHLLDLDSRELDPVLVRSLKMNMKPDVTTFASQRLLRLLYIQQLSRARVSPYIPPADTTDVPIVVLVGREAVGKGSLVRRLAKECSSNITMACQHTTATHHLLGHYIEISRTKFDDMLLAGEFLTYTELDGESYGLSREEAFVKDGKIKVVSMDLVSALMLRLRGYRPYLILATCQDKTSLTNRQLMRKMFRMKAYQAKESPVVPQEQSTLQVLLSGRIIITGILNEILMTVPEENEYEERAFTLESECSLMMDSETRKEMIKDYAQCNNLLAIVSSCTPTSSLDDLLAKRHIDKPIEADQSLYSLYKESQESKSNDTRNRPNSVSQENRRKNSQKKEERSISLRNPVDFSRYTSSTWKVPPAVVDGSKSSKSVTFNSQDTDQADTLGLIIEARTSEDNKSWPKSISARAPDRFPRVSTEESELWLAFLIEAGMFTNRSSLCDSENKFNEKSTSKVEDDSILNEMNLNFTIPENIRMQAKNEDYEEIHRECPGTFWDTVNMDNPDKAFLKVRDVIRSIMKTQPDLQPMFDIDFGHLENYSTVQERLLKITQEIAPHQIFH